MRISSRGGWKEASVILFAVCGAVVLVTWGCGGSGSTGQSVSTNDCVTLGSDAAVSIGNSDELIATAITNGCDELAVYAEDGARLKQVAISTEQGTAELIYDDEGELVAIRGDDGDTASLNLNDATNAVRVNIDGSNPSSATLAVERETLPERRNPSQVSDRDSLCDSLRDTTRVTSAMTDACDSDSPPGFCNAGVARAAAAVRRLCASDQNVLEVASITDRRLGNQAMDVGLGVDGYATTRAAAGGGTTFILSAVPFGGNPPTNVTWSQVSGDSTVSLQQFQGDVAIGDGTTNQGSFVFRTTATDSSGATSTDDVTVDLDANQGLMISVTDPSPDSGQVLTFTAVGANIPANATYFWTFGDGGNGTGQSVDYAFDVDGTYSVSVFVTTTGRDLKDNVNITVGDAVGQMGRETGSGGTVNYGDFIVDIQIGTPDFLVPGEQRQISAQVTGAFGDVQFVWGILNQDAGGGSVFDEGDVVPINAQTIDQFAFSETPTLQADNEGVMLVGVLAFDSSAQIGEAIRPIPVFGPEGGLFSAIIGPLLLDVGQTGKFESFLVGASGELTYNWRGKQDAFCLAGRSAVFSTPRQATTDVRFDEPGCAILELTVTDSDSGRQSVSMFTLDVLSTGDCPLDGICDPGCGGLDPDCLSAEVCPEDGICDDEFCGPADPDCFGVAFCIPGDFICDAGFCPTGQDDPDCVSCSAGNTCIDFCPQPDPDCGIAGCPFDFFCDPNCSGFDPDCEQIDVSACGADNFCEVDCYFDAALPPDPDCSNADICQATGGIAGSGFCCAPDAFCDDDCPTPDPECNGGNGSGDCTFNGTCDLSCSFPFDPDCTNSQICADSGFCCSQDSFCDDARGCPAPDDDCVLCGENGTCIQDCVPGDPDCLDLPCEQDGLCNPICIAPFDPDCSNAELCQEADFCCVDDFICDADFDCPAPDVDCALCGLDDGVCIDFCTPVDQDCF